MSDPQARRVAWQNRLNSEMLSAKPNPGHRAIAELEKQGRLLLCNARGPTEETLARVRAGEADPPCEHCGGMLKSATVSFGQNLFPGDMERSEAAAQQAT